MGGKHSRTCPYPTEQHLYLDWREMSPANPCRTELPRPTQLHNTRSDQIRSTTNIFNTVSAPAEYRAPRCDDKAPGATGCARKEPTPWEPSSPRRNTQTMLLKQLRTHQELRGAFSHDDTAYRWCVHAAYSLCAHLVVGRGQSSQR